MRCTSGRNIAPVSCIITAAHTVLHAYSPRQARVGSRMAHLVAIWHNMLAVKTGVQPSLALCSVAVQMASDDEHSEVAANQGAETNASTRAWRQQDPRTKRTPLNWKFSGRHRLSGDGKSRQKPSMSRTSVRRSQFMTYVPDFILVSLPTCRSARAFYSLLQL